MKESSSKQDITPKKGGSFLNKLLFLSLTSLGIVAGVKYSGLADSGDSTMTGDIVETIRQSTATAFKSKSGLARFTGFWIPIEMMGKYKPSDYILGLIYLEDDNVFGEFEGPAENYKARGRWIKITEFDYDKDTGVLSIDFAKNDPKKGRDSATFQIDDNDHLFMTNPGGTYEFFRATDNNMEENYKLLKEEYDRKAKDMPIQQGLTTPSVIPKGDMRTE